MDTCDIRQMSAPIRPSSSSIVQKSAGKCEIDHTRKNKFIWNPPYTQLHAAGTVCGIWDGRRDRVHFFELRLLEPPKLKLDNREIVVSQLASPTEWYSMVLTGPTAAYIAQASGGSCGRLRSTQRRCHFNLAPTSHAVGRD